MITKFKTAMDILYDMTQEQINAYRKVDVDARDVYWEFSHELAGVTTAAIVITSADESITISEYANELRERVWKETANV